MPYIAQDRRDKFDGIINILVRQLDEVDCTPGDLNYIFSTTIWRTWEKQGGGYTNANNLIGMLECVKQEFYRRKVAPYEDEKIIQNGDVE